MTRAGLRVCLLLVFGLPMAACDRSPPVEHSHFYAMGTRIEISLPADTPEAEALRERIRTHFTTFDERWSPWGNGALGRLNQKLSESKSATVPAELRYGLAEALTLGRASNDLFHPAIGELVAAWGFHRQPRPDDPPPSERTLEALTAGLPATETIRLENGTLTLPRPGVRLDTGAFAKGLSLDELQALLSDESLTGLLVSAGGDVLAIGDAPADDGRRPWRVGILDPRSSEVLAGVALADGECIMTSGDYERRFEYEGNDYHHLLDPRTGRPAREAASVTVIARDCARADAAATALFIAGPDEWPMIARAMAVDTVMRVAPDGAVTLTPAMEARADFTQEPDNLRTRPLP